jgi:hypothetical protein
MWRLHGRTHSRAGGDPVLASLTGLNVQLDTRLRGYDDGFGTRFEKLAVDLPFYLDAIALVQTVIYYSFNSL